MLQYFFRKTNQVFLNSRFLQKIFSPYLIFPAKVLTLQLRNIRILYQALHSKKSFNQIEERSYSLERLPLPGKFWHKCWSNMNDQLHSRSKSILEKCSKLVFQQKWTVRQALKKYSSSALCCFVGLDSLWIKRILSATNTSVMWSSSSSADKKIRGLRLQIKHIPTNPCSESMSNIFRHSLSCVSA